MKPAELLNQHREQVRAIPLSHSYFSVDRSLIWVTRQNDLPVLRANVERFCGELGQEVFGSAS